MHAKNHMESYPIPPFHGKIGMRSSDLSGRILRENKARMASLAAWFVPHSRIVDEMTMTAKMHLPFLLDCKKTSLSFTPSRLFHIFRELKSTLLQELLACKLLEDKCTCLVHMRRCNGRLLLLMTKLLVCTFKFKVLYKFQNPMLFLWPSY